MLGSGDAAGERFSLINDEVKPNGIGSLVDADPARRAPMGKPPRGSASASPRSSAMAAGSRCTGSATDSSRLSQQGPGRRVQLANRGSVMTRGRGSVLAVANAVSTGASVAASSIVAAKQATEARFVFGAIDLNEEKNADLVIARHLWQDHRLLPPMSEARSRWERVLLFLVIYSLFVLPLRMAFGGADGLGFTIFEMGVDACFWVDIIVQFRTAILTRDYELIFEPGQSKAAPPRPARAPPARPPRRLPAAPARCRHTRRAATSTKPRQAPSCHKRRDKRRAATSAATNAATSAAPRHHSRSLRVDPLSRRRPHTPRVHLCVSSTPPLHPLRSPVAKQYISSGWFFAHAFAALPFDYFTLGLTSWEHRSAMQANRLLRALRLLATDKSITDGANVDRRVTTAEAWMRIFVDFRGGCRCPRMHAHSHSPPIG